MLQFLKSLVGSESEPPELAKRDLGGPPYNPLDWEIIEESPSGHELTFANESSGYATYYTPPGMTAKEILAIPGADKYWGNEAEVEWYIKERAEAKEKCGGRDFGSPPSNEPPSTAELELLEAGRRSYERARNAPDPK